MTTHSRETKVLVVLGVSIILGAIILNALGHNPPSAGAFCLSRYYRLGSVKKSILSRADQSPGRWSRIEIYYSNTESGNIESAYGGLSDVGGDEHINCHFVICDGRVGHDGQIEPTEKWQRQSSVLARPSRDRSFKPGQNRSDEPAMRTGPSGSLKPWIQTNVSERLINYSRQTIRICVIVDDKAKIPTDFQIRRTEALVEVLCRKFDIQPESNRYPDDWR